MSLGKLRRQRAWNHMRRNHCFTRESLREFGGGLTYLDHLIEAGYVFSAAPYSRFLRLRPSGNLAPDFRRGLNDPNRANGHADVEQRTWGVLRMMIQIDLHEIQKILGVKSRNKISEYCARLIDSGLLTLVDPPPGIRASRYCYNLRNNLGPIAPIPTPEGVWDCNQIPEVLHEYHN